MLQTFLFPLDNDGFGVRELPGDNGDIGGMRSLTFDREVEAMYVGGFPFWEKSSISQPFFSVNFGRVL